MAAVAPPADQAVEMMHKLSLDSGTKTVEIPDATKKPSIDSSKSNGIHSDRSVTPLLPDCMDPTVCYVPNGYSPGYYYSGHDGNANKWEDHTKYVNPDGVEMTPGVYGDSRSLMYPPGYSYAPYGPYSHVATPVPTVGHDVKLYGTQPYQYPTPYFPSTLPPTSGPYPIPAAPTKGDIATSADADRTTLPVDSTNSKPNGIANSGGAKGNNKTAPVKATYQSPSFNVNGSYGRGALPGVVPVSGYGFDGLHLPYPWVESPYYSSRPVDSSSMNSSISNGNGIPASRNQNFRPHLMGLHHPRPMPGMSQANGYLGGMYPNKLYSQYGNNFRSGFGYAANGYDSQSNGRGWMAVDTMYKPRGRGNGFNYFANESFDGLNELNRGPRCKISKNQKDFTPGVVAVKGQNIPLTGTNDSEENISSVTPDREQYNQPGFLETHADAKFFVIKSYSEDDVHNSIKYNVWASTPNGNKKLDAAYLEAQQKSGGCPVLLFFSVNTSGQFIGVAEMIGPVDFNKNVEYWQQDKWIGCFPVKWHIVKDVPNSLLKHITLENNENKPVTNSRDTQEVKLEQGLQVIKMFKDQSSKQCILDDFGFYEDRQKRVQERKAKQQQQFKKQAQLGTDLNGPKSQKTSSEPVSSDLNKEAASVIAEDTGDIPKNVQLGGVTEEVVNGC